MKTLKDLRVKSKSSNYSLQEKIEEINKFTISKNIKPKVFLEKHPEITKDLFIDTMKKINKPFRNKSPLQQKRIVNRNIPTKKALRGVIDIVMFKSTEESKSSAWGGRHNIVLFNNDIGIINKSGEIKGLKDMDKVARPTTGTEIIDRGKFKTKQNIKDQTQLSLIVNTMSALANKNIVGTKGGDGNFYELDTVIPPSLRDALLYLEVLGEETPTMKYIVSSVMNAVEGLENRGSLSKNQATNFRRTFNRIVKNQNNKINSSDTLEEWSSYKQLKKEYKDRILSHKIIAV